ncbi:secreted frizzled-related protein 3-like [Lineus longissimus]|uniref:secreted frizzled-related protein 3-like n=1 Tax=Lineus longissimus TaxID=88925 RepID=UPI00315C7458
MEQKAILLAVLWFVVIFLFESNVVSSAQCEQIQIPMCQRMQYNMTRMPNLLHHSTQKNAILAIEQFEQLVDTQCSSSLLFFLCSMYAPICTMEFSQDAIPPCRSVCENSKIGCEPVMLRYNVSWPESLDCTRLPSYNRGVCIMPDAIVAKMPEEKGRKKGKGKGKGKKNKRRRGKKNVARKPDRCNRRCKKRKFREKIYQAKKFDYAIRAKWKESDKDTMGTTIIKVEVVEVIKHGRVAIAVGDANLWTNTSCICPRFRKSREYFILGHEDAVNERLLYLRQSLSYTWKNTYPRLMQKWDAVASTTIPVTNDDNRANKDDEGTTGKKKKKKKKKKGKKKNTSRTDREKKERERRRRNRHRTPRPTQSVATQATFFI